MKRCVGLKLKLREEKHKEVNKSYKIRRTLVQKLLISRRKELSSSHKQK